MLFACVLIFIASAACAALAPEVSFQKSADSLDILIGGKPVAIYVWHDDRIPRPYFRQVFAPDGIRVTRPNPPDPVANKGNDDHPTFHPGIWLAFGDINGADFWRNKATVKHVRFAEEPKTEGSRGTFSVVNRYENGTLVCEETCSYTIVADKNGYFLLSESTFSSPDHDFAFGDQEEMGFGVRLDTPLTVKFGSGGIVNSEGGRNEAGTWGKQAKWCAFSGVMGGRRAGVSIMPDPSNFRPSWFHSRDYGLLVANPFGKKAMTAPDDPKVAPDKTVVKKGETFRLAFGVYIFSVPEANDVDFGAAYDKYLSMIKK
jgi:hypothetical protein